MVCWSTPLRCSPPSIVRGGFTPHPHITFIDIKNAFVSISPLLLREILSKLGIWGDIYFQHITLVRQYSGGPPNIHPDINT